MSAITQNDIFTSLPNIGNPLKLRENLYISLIQKLLYKLEFIEKESGIGLTDIMTKLLSLNLKEKICSGLFVFDYGIANALKNKNIDNIIDIIHDLAIYLTTYVNPVQSLQIESILTRPWEKYFIGVLRNQDIDHHLHKTVIVRPTLGLDLKQEREDIDFVLKAIKHLDKGLSEEINQYITYLKFFSGKAIVGATSRQNFGTIYLRLCDDVSNENARYLYYIEHITHEVSHLNLHAMMDLDKIITNDESKLYDAPIRLDPRPMYGIFHATFVLSRVVRILKKFKDENLIDGSEIYNDMVQRYRRGYSTVKKHALFTECGKQIFDSFQETSGIEG